MAQKEKEEWSTIDLDNSDEQEKVEFEIEGQEEEEREEVAQQEEPVEEAPAPVSTTIAAAEESKEPAQPKELEGIETNGAQKRIRQLIKQRKERDEQIGQLRQEIEQLRSSVNRKDEELRNTLSSSFESTQGQLDSRLGQAKIAYKQAAEQGDTDAMLAAQEEISTVNAEKIALRENKKSFDNYANNYQQEKEREDQQRQQTVQQAEPRYDPKAIEWASKNPWFGSDQPMTMAALQIDAALKEEGFDPSDEEYYEEVDSRLQKLFPSKLGQVAPVKEEPAPRLQDAPSNSAQVVAGASRTPKTSSSNKKVKLTQEDIRLAEKWGITLEQYAAEKLKVEQSDGDYTTVS